MHQHFLRQIVEDWNDDAPRLVYADWLEENGDSNRAEFIRIQCELARGDYPGMGEAAHRMTFFGNHGEKRAGGEADSRRRALRTREYELLATNENDWLGELCNVPAQAWEFRRGFVEGVRLLHQDEFLIHGQTITRTSSVRHLYCLWHSPSQLLHSDLLSLLKSLDLQELSFTGGPDDPLQALANSENAINLTALQVAMNDVSDAGLIALANSPNLARLVSLDLGGDSVGDRGIQALATSPFVTNLKFLDLDSTNVGPEGLTALANSPNMNGLRFLRLTICNVGDRGAQALASSPFMKQLVYACLSCSEIEDAGAQALADASGFEELAHLDLRGNTITGPVVQALRQRYGQRVLL